MRLPTLYIKARNIEIERQGRDVTFTINYPDDQVLTVLKNCAGHQYGSLFLVAKDFNGKDVIVDETVLIKIKSSTNNKHVPHLGQWVVKGVINDS